jgi:Lactonase, 7-bladed beta-propeller
LKLASAVNEITAGALQSYDINPNGTLSTAIDTVLTGGDSPAFATALSTGEVAVFNYNSGNGRIVPTTAFALYFDDSSAPEITFPLTSTSPKAVSHPHMALEYNDEVLVPDLVSFQGANERLTFSDVVCRSARVVILYGDLGALCPDIMRFMGPYPNQQAVGQDILPYTVRHSYRVTVLLISSFLDDRLFTLHELSSTLTVECIPAAPNGTSSIIASVSITPPNPPQNATFAAAEILIPKPTKKFCVPYIYVSNRNTGTQDPRGDTIAIFEHVNQGTPFEGLELVRQVYTGLDQIRGMEIGPADERGGEEYLVASGFAGTAGVLVFRRTEGGRNLELVAKNTEIPTRTSFVWL